MAVLKPTEAALRVLKDCTVEGNIIKLPGEQLSRDLYQEVRKLLELIGGKWKGGKTYGFVFEHSGDDLQELLDAQANGDGRNLKKEYQFFATPPELARRMAQLLSPGGDIPPLAKVMEPSAGDGALIKEVRKYYPKLESVDCFELMNINRLKLLKLSHTKLLGEDFLVSVDVDSLNLIRGQYDYIIANPPFTKNQDIDHIRAMYRCLKTNGRIVTVASSSWTHGSQKKQVEFREWLQSIDAFQEELPAGTFSESGTEVGAMLLVIDRLEEAETMPFVPSGFKKIKDPLTIIGTPEFSIPVREDSHERKCRKCGCTENNACVDEHGHSCYWVDEDLCSACLDVIEEINSAKKGGRELGKKILTDKNSKSHSNMKKITIPASPLMDLLKKVKEVITKHPTLNVLSNVLIKVERKEIKIIATDLMVTIIGTIPVTNDGDQKYEYLLPFDYLFDIANLIGGLDLTIEIVTLTKKAEGKKVDVFNAILTTYTDTFNQEDLDNPADWPVMPDFPQENSVGIGGDFVFWLTKAVETARPAKDNTAPAQQKIFIDIANEGIVMASTNGSVLFEKSFKAESRNAATLLVNTKIAKALKGFKETSISWSDTHLAFVCNGITMIGTLQDERFPNYQRLFPEEPAANLKLSLFELTGVMNKAALTKKHATIYTRREIGVIVVDSQDEIYNRKVTVRIPADYSGECEQIIVNPEHMLLLLEQIEYSTIALSITGPDKPIVITTDSDPTYRSLTMPLANQ